MLNALGLHAAAPPPPTSSPPPPPLSQLFPFRPQNLSFSPPYPPPSSPSSFFWPPSQNLPLPHPRLRWLCGARGRASVLKRYQLDDDDDDDDGANIIRATRSFTPCAPRLCFCLPDISYIKPATVMRPTYTAYPLFSRKYYRPLLYSTLLYSTLIRCTDAIFFSLTPLQDDAGWAQMQGGEREGETSNSPVQLFPFFLLVLFFPSRFFFRFVLFLFSSVFFSPPCAPSSRSSRNRCTEMQNANGV